MSFLRERWEKNWPGMRAALLGGLPRFVLSERPAELGDAVPVFCYHTVDHATLEADLGIPLEIEDSPFRDIGRYLTSYVRRLRPNGRDRCVTVIIPEFIVSKAHHHFLHGQTALLVKRHLLFQEGVVVASGPDHVQDAGIPSGPAERGGVGPDHHR
jgi:hypothetical protein